MADKKVSQLTALTGANTASGDLLYIVDVSEPVAADQSKKITLTEFQSAPISAGTANGVAYLNASKVLTTGSALTFDGTNFATTGTSTGLRLIASSTDASGSVLQVDTTATVYGRVGGSTTMGYVAGTQSLWTIGGSEQMRLTSTGLGIGTSSPGQALTVQGGINVTSSATLPAAQGPMLFSYEAPINRIYMGDGTGYSFSFSKRVSSTTTDLMTLTDSGNLGLGVDPSAWGSGGNLDLPSGGGVSFGSSGGVIASNAYYNAGWKYKTNQYAVKYDQQQNAGQHQWYTAPSGTAGDPITFTQALTLDASGNLRIALTGAAYNTERLTVFKSGNAEAAAFVNEAGANNYTIAVSNRATTGDNLFAVFATESSDTTRGSIVYNRAAGLVAYNTTSDYRAKDIIGLVQNPGATIDALKVYEGVMNGATRSRPMLIAHEAQEHAPYAVSGVKDEVNEDGTPKFQQMDVSSLVPLLIAELQSLRARVAQLEGN